MSIQPRTVTVTLLHHPPSRSWFKDRRWQPWNWVATASNGKVLAISSEMYTNREDCLDAVMALFGTQSNEWLREGHDDLSPWALRRAVA